MGTTLLHNAKIINEGESFDGFVLITNSIIEKVGRGEAPEELLDKVDEVRDLKGDLLLPGVIDVHVHFREPGLTHKADIRSESRAALAGGVTSFFEMPNTNPQTTSVAALSEKLNIAEKDSAVNYAFFIGATNDNYDELVSVDYSAVPGIKAFLGSSTGNMLVEGEKNLDRIFKLGPIVAVHCEDEGIISKNARRAKGKYGEKEVPVSEHPHIRTREACLISTKNAIERAKRHNSDLHVCHLSTEEEVELLKSCPDNITAEACVAHLLFSEDDYDTLGALIKCNPAIKSSRDRAALRDAVRDGVIDIVATDHAPHLLSEKEGGALKAVSGMPMIQFSLPLMLKMAAEGAFPIERVVEVMAHNPASRFGIERRGFIREGYYADLVVVTKHESVISRSAIKSKCGWSPVENVSLPYTVKEVYVNGDAAWRDEKETSHKSLPLRFLR